MLPCFTQCPKTTHKTSDAPRHCASCLCSAGVSARVACSSPSSRINSLACRESGSYTTIQGWLFVSTVNTRFRNTACLSVAFSKLQNLSSSASIPICFLPRHLPILQSHHPRIFSVIVVRTEEDSTIALATLMSMLGQEAESSCQILLASCNPYKLFFNFATMSPSYQTSDGMSANTSYQVHDGSEPCLCPECHLQRSSPGTLTVSQTVVVINGSSAAGPVEKPSTALQQPSRIICSLRPLKTAANNAGGYRAAPPTRPYVKSYTPYPGLRIVQVIAQCCQCVCVSQVCAVRHSHRPVRHTAHFRRFILLV